jgi:acyl-CoA thioesterase I
MAPKDIRICFIGDSFVNGTGDETFLGWTGRVCAAATNISDISLTCYNLGIRRNTSTDILQRWEHECAVRLSDFCDGRVVLSCGVNDMVIEDAQHRVPADESCNNIRQILQRANSKYKTLMVGPAPVGDDNLNHRLKNISAAYAQEAQKLGIPYIELFSHLADNRRYLLESRNNDGYHPMSYGYAAIANIIRKSDQWWFR